MHLSFCSRPVAAIGLSFLLLASPGTSQQAPAPAKPADGAKPDIKAAIEEVVLDLVIRDKKGKELRDLELSDIQVFDNNKKAHHQKHAPRRRT